MIKRLFSILRAGGLLLAAATLAQMRSSGQELSAPADRAWDVIWSRFYLPKVQTFGDYLSSYEKGREQAHLPTAEEVARARSARV